MSAPDRQPPPAPNLADIHDHRMQNFEKSRAEVVLSPLDRSAIQDASSPDLDYHQGRQLPCARLHMDLKSEEFLPDTGL